MRKTEYIRRAERRIARAEAQTDATMRRAIDRMIWVLEREKTEYQIYANRLKKRIFR